MTVNPISTSPITIPDSFAYPDNIPTGKLSSPTQKNIFETFVNDGRNGVFQNPLTDLTGGLNDNLNQLYDIVTNSSCLSGGDKSTILSALGTGGIGGLSEQLSLFSTHLDILSGVLPQGTNATPGLERILSVGTSLGNLSNAIDGASDCFSLLNSMTGLFSEDLLNGYTSEIAGMIALVNNCLADAIEISLRLQEIATELQSIINADRNYFQNALDRLIQAALASLLESMYSNPCGKLLLERIGQDKLLGFLR